MGRARDGIGLLAATALLAAGCSSSGGGAVSQSQLESKLKSEPQIKTVLDQGGIKAELASKLTNCIAKGLKKAAKPDDLKKYVDGKEDISALTLKSNGAKQQAAAIVKSCAKNAVGSG